MMNIFFYPLCRTQFCSPAPWGWTLTPSTPTQMKIFGARWSSPTSKRLSLICPTNSTTSAQREERTSGTQFCTDMTRCSADGSACRCFLYAQSRSNSAEENLVCDCLPLSLHFVCVVWVSANWSAWPGPCLGKPRSWFWTKRRPLWTWRRTCSFSQPSARSLRTALSWPSLIASTLSWTTRGTQPQDVWRLLTIQQRDRALTATIRPLIYWVDYWYFM